MKRATHGDLMLSTIDRLMRERAELLEEIRQLRAAVAIYKRVADRVTEDWERTGTR